MASRFWVGGTGTWDGSDTTHWSATSGGAGGQSVPGSADAVTLDGSSGGGTVTVNTTVTVSSITMGAFTGTLDFSANNNNVTIGGWVNNGSAVRTFNMGNGTWTLTGSGGAWSQATVTNLTFNANSSTIIQTQVQSNIRTFAGGGLTYNIVSFPGNTGGGGLTITGANTFGTLLVGAPNRIAFPSTTTTTITNAFTFTGASGSYISLMAGTFGTTGTVSVASGTATLTYGFLCDLTFTGGATFTATNSYNLGNNNGITITEPGGAAPPPAPITATIYPPKGGDSRYNLLFKAAQNAYARCGQLGKSGMKAPVLGDYEYNLCYKLALNTYILASP